MIRLLVDWVIRQAKKRPYVHIGGTNDSDYMRRWWLVPYNRFGISCRVHEILQSDDDRAYHDHPWWYITVVLRGGYWEIRPKYDRSGIFVGDSCRWIGPGRVLFRRAKSWHRLEIPNGQTAFTLFICGRKAQDWGFLVNPKNKVAWWEYLPPRDPHTSKEYE